MEAIIKFPKFRRREYLLKIRQRVAKGSISGFECRNFNVARFSSKIYQNLNRTNDVILSDFKNINKYLSYIAVSISEIIFDKYKLFLIIRSENIDSHYLIRFKAYIHKYNHQNMTESLCIYLFVYSSILIYLFYISVYLYIYLI